MDPGAQALAAPPGGAGGFSIDDFTHDPVAGTLTCPNGVTRYVTTKRTTTFGAACRSCPLAPRCTTSRRGRRIKLDEHDQQQREHRARAADHGFQATYRTHRPMVERTIAWLTRSSRCVPYRGVTKNDAWLHHRAAAINLRRLLALGLTHRSGAW